MREPRSTELGFGSRLVVAFAWVLLVAAADPSPVTVRDQRVQLDVDGKTLVLEGTVDNALAVALRAVTIGWVLASDEKQLETLRDPGALYLEADDPKHVQAPPGLTVLQRRLDVAVPAHGAARTRATTPLETTHPAVYRTHVIAYALADASFELALQLIGGTTAADEIAAVDYAGVTGSAADKKRAREAMRRGQWLPAVTRMLSTPVSPPNPRLLHERVYAIRALGVIGGDEAREVLTALRDCSDMAAFDDLLRAMLIDRLRGNRLETPLAFAIPTTARKMHDLFEAALEDASSDFDTPSEAVPALEASHAVVEPRQDDSDAETPRAAGEGDRAPPALSWRLLGAVACGTAFIVTLLVLRRRRSR